MQHVLVALQYEKASRYSISIFCNFTLWMPPILDALGRRPFSHLHILSAAKRSTRKSISPHLHIFSSANCKQKLAGEMMKN